MNIFQSLIPILIPILPWVLLLFVIIVGLAVIYYLTYENSGSRGAITYLGHLLIVWLGWSVGKEMGLVLISLPLLIYYYYMMFHLAMVIVPISDPDNLRDWWRLVATISYICTVSVGISISSLDGIRYNRRKN